MKNYYSSEKINERINERTKIYDLLAEVIGKPSFLNELQKRYPNVDWNQVQYDDGQTSLMHVQNDIEHLNIDATIYYP